MCVSLPTAAFERKKILVRLSVCLCVCVCVFVVEGGERIYIHTSKTGPQDQACNQLNCIAAAVAIAIAREREAGNIRRRGKIMFAAVCRLYLYNMLCAID